jgi:hypothetical protein
VEVQNRIINKIMGLNSTATAWNFGQLGSGVLTTHSTALTPPSGKVIVAITVVEATKFDALVADASQTDDIAFLGTAAQVAQNGGNSEAFPVSVEIPAGTTIYGRWTSVTLDETSNGTIIAYYGY